MDADEGVVYRCESDGDGGGLPFACLKTVMEPRRRLRGQSASRGEQWKQTRGVALDGERPGNDEDVFRTAMKGVREIPEFQRLPAVGGTKRRKLGPRAGQDSHGESRGLREIVCGIRDLDLSLTDEYVEWRRPDQPKDLARRLHRGDFSVQETLDLHGLVRDEALEALAGFLVDIRRRGLYCVKIIHGRGLRSPGEPVLRSAVREWLVRGPQRKRIRAFSTAQGRDGGLGAIYVLLRK